MPSIRPTEDVDLIVQVLVHADYLFSHDLDDLLALIDGRDTLVAEGLGSITEPKVYLHDKLAALLANPAFMQALPGHLPGDAASQERVPDLAEKLRKLSSLI
jgi:hypothetical protein